MPLHLSRMRCNVCAGPLSVHEEARGGYCSQPSCWQAVLQRELEKHKAADAAVLKECVAVTRRSVAARLELASPEALPTAVVPSRSQPIVKLTRRRKSDFRRHLVELVAELFREDGAAAPGPLQEDDLPTAQQFVPEPPALRDGCATCRGYCCRSGGASHAFLNIQTLRRYRALHPHERPRQIVLAYTSRIPAKVTKASCVYHGDSGCTLPREMRAEICNVYHCGGLKEIEGLIGNSAARKILILATTETAVVRWRVHDRDEGATAERGPPQDPSATGA